MEKNNNLLIQFWEYKQILCCEEKKKKTQEINMYY